VQVIIPVWLGLMLPAGHDAVQLGGTDCNGIQSVRPSPSTGPSVQRLALAGNSLASTKSSRLPVGIATSRRISV